MELKKIHFYYKHKKYGKEYYLETIICKYPKKTKLYKTLLQNLNDNFIHCFGWDIEPENKKKMFIKV